MFKSMHKNVIMVKTNSIEIQFINGGFSMSKSQVDNTRKELFITLEYLVRNCHNSKHTSKTIELTEYALK